MSVSAESRTKTWPSIDQVAERLKVSKNVVEKWCHKRCRPLGRLMRHDRDTRLVLVGGKLAEREVTVCDPADVRKVEKKRLIEIPKGERLPDRFTREELKDTWGWSYDRIWKYQKKGVPELGNKKLVPQKESIWFKNGTGGIMKREKSTFAGDDAREIEAAIIEASKPYEDAEGVWLSEWAQQDKYSTKFCYYRTHKSTFLRDENGKKRTMRRQLITRRLPCQHKDGPKDVTIDVDNEKDILAIIAGRRERERRFKEELARAKKLNRRKTPKISLTHEKADPHTHGEDVWYTGRYYEAHFPISASTLTKLRKAGKIRYKEPSTERSCSNHGAYLYPLKDVLRHIEHRDHLKHIPGVNGRWGQPPQPPQAAQEPAPEPTNSAERIREVRKRRAKEKHLEWKRMHDEEGKSARLIAYIWTTEKRIPTTEDAVKKALKRLRPKGAQNVPRSPAAEGGTTILSPDNKPVP